MRQYQLLAPIAAAVARDPEEKLGKAGHGRLPQSLWGVEGEYRSNACRAPREESINCPHTVISIQQLKENFLAES